MRPTPLLLLTLVAACAAPAAGPGEMTPASPVLEPAAALPRGEEPTVNSAGLVLYSAGGDRLLADPRDAGLRRAVGLLDERLLELVEDQPMAPRVLSLLAALLASPASLTLDATEPAAGMPLRLQLDVAPDDGASPGRTRAVAAELARLLADLGADGAETPLGPLEHGLVGAGEEERIFVALGGMEPGPLGLGSMDLPVGVEPLLAVQLDLPRLSSAVEMLLGGLGPDAEETYAQLAAFGLLGPDAMRVRFAWGVEEGVAHFATRTGGYRQAMERSGWLEPAPLEPSDLGLIPSDAVSAALQQSAPSGLIDWITMLAPEDGGDPLELIQALTGIHLERDLVDHLGSTLGWYTADSTGGGGMLSLVLFLEVRDEEGLRGTVDYLLGTLDDLAASQWQGRVESRDWLHGDARCTTVTFPGWPIPLEPSLAVADGFLFVTLSPQALAAALDQRASRGPGLAANRRFLAGARGSLDDLSSVAFTDTARRAGEGYPFATLLTAALANGVRSPEEPGRDPGLVLPTYSELIDDARPTVALARIEGDDLVAIGTGDGSMTVQLAALCGSPLLQAIGAGAAIAVPMGLFWITPMMQMTAEPAFELEELSPEEEAEELRRLLEQAEEDR
ncbi:MAG: hypothetical protein AAF682_18985 [Planctomycetota bacterium]